MAEQREAPSIPPVNSWFKVVRRQDGSIDVMPGDGFYKLIVGERARTINVNSGVSDLQSALEDVQTTATQQVAAANQAAAAAITSGGSTTTDYASAVNQGVSSDTFATVLTCDITTTGAGTHTLTATLAPTAFSMTALISSGDVFSGAWQIIEEPSTTVLFSGTFTITQTLNGGEGGTPFYTYDIAFGTALPSGGTVASVDTGAVTVEFQLKRASGTNTVSGLSATLLAEWA